MIDIAPNERDIPVSAGNEMIDREMRTGSVINEDGRVSLSRHFEIDEDDGYAETLNLVDEALRDFPRNDDAVYIPFEEETGEVFFLRELVSDGGKQDIEVLLTGGKLSTQKNACVERLSLRKVIVPEDKSDVTAGLGGEATCGASGVIPECLDNPRHTFACLFAHISTAVDDDGYRRDGTFCFPGNIFDGWAFHGAPLWQGHEPRISRRH